MSNLKLYDRPSTALRTLGGSWADLFDGFWNNDFARSFEPRVEVTERDKDYRLSIEVPGMSKEDIHVEVKEGVLRFHGEKKAEKHEKDECCSYSERTFGSFDRSFRLPRHVDTGNIGASYKNGILELTIPKTEEAKPKEIKVKVE